MPQEQQPLPSRRPLKVASVGLGWVCTHRHLPVMRKNPRYEIVGVIDRQEDRARKVAQDFNIGRIAVTHDLTQVPWLDEVEALTIATSPRGHYELLRSALELGKHVLTEKPFTLTRVEAEDLVETAQRVQRTVAVVHNFQFASSFLKLKADIATGRLGRITSVQAIQFSNPRRRLPVWYDELPLGLFYDESPHLLYLLRALAPDGVELKDAFSQADARKNTPTLLCASLVGHAGKHNIPMTLQFNFAATVSEWQLLVFGTRRCGIVDIFRDIYVTLPNDELHTTPTVVRTSATTTWQHWGQHLTSGLKHLRGELFYGNEEVFSRFQMAAQTGEAPRGISAADALAVVRLQHEIIEAVAQPDAIGGAGR